MRTTIPEPSPDRPWLVADIGGTNGRFGLVTEPGGTPHRVKILRCRYYPDLASAMRTYLEYVADVPRPKTACVAVAGPVDGDRFRLTNAEWDFSIAESRRDLGLDHLELVNDFTALALAVPHLPADALVSVGGGPRVPGKPVAVVGPGTGLGVGGLVPAGGSGVPIDGEGGHVTLPAETEREVAVAAILRARHGSVSAETVLSGPGLSRLHQAVSALHRGEGETLSPEQQGGEGETLSPEQHRGEGEILSPEQICARARHGTDAICVEAVRMFCDLLGAFAGNVALTLGARGGVVLGGGILPSIADLLAASDFRLRFEGKPPMTEYLSPIATELITAATPALHGAAAWLAQYRETPETHPKGRAA